MWPRDLPGIAPAISSEYLPSEATKAAYALLLAKAPLKMRNFMRDIEDTVWLMLDNEQLAGRLAAREVDALRADRNGDYSIPLVRRYLAVGNVTPVTLWMRRKPSFWNFDWIDSSIRGAHGQGTFNIFEVLRTEGGATEGAVLAADHLWYRLVGARYREGLRWYLREWRKHTILAERKDAVLAHRAAHSHPHYIEKLFDWLDFSAARLEPIIAVGPPEAITRRERVLREVAEHRQRFEAELA
jgi:hypothetical protein